MQRISVGLFFIVALAGSIFSEPNIEPIDKTRIAEAYRVGERLQNKIWPGWSAAPFGILFITEEHEFLIRHPKPNDEFVSIGYDQTLKSEIFVRPRKCQKNFLATFPAFGTPLIVIGKAENTSEKTSTRWIFTVLHEHFHQLQMSKPTYFEDVNALDLSGGDTSGMWQLNFPFAYSDKALGERFRSLADILLEATQNNGRKKNLKDYIAARKEFAASMKPADYRYLSFQLWQEGIARYTQYKIADLASKKLRPSGAFRRLADYTSFRSEADRLRKQIDDEMREVDLSKWERVAFYPFGASEGLLLDRVDPRWKRKYFVKKFALENYYPNR